MKPIIFDMDGVLVDSEPVHFEATRQLLEERGISRSADSEGDFFGCTDREVFRWIKERYGLPEHEDDLAERWIARVVELLPGRIVAMRGVPDVLERLKAAGARLALASSSSPAVIATTLAGLRLDSMFETTVSGRDVSAGKPAPDIFLEAARRLGVAPDRCLVVEDSRNGLLASMAAGMPCVVIPCPATEGQDFSGATGRLRSLQELPEWVEGWFARG